MKSHKQLLVKRFKDDPLHMWIQTDVHEGNEEYHRDEHIEYQNWFYNTDGAKTIWLGDMFEWAIPIHLPQAMKLQNIRTTDQWLLLEEKIRKEKPLVFLAGNHEQRLIRYGYGYDPFEKLCNEHKVPYSRTDMFWRTYWNKTWYSWYLNHGYGSSYYPDSAFKSLSARGVLGNIDIAAMGHTHHNWIGGKLLFDIQKLDLHVKQQHWVRGGSFYTLPEYVKSMRPELIGNVIISFDSSKSDLIFSRTLEEWRDTYE